MILKKIFFKLMGKLWKMLENIEILNLSQQKKEETVSCQNQIIIVQSCHRKSISSRNEKKM